MIIKVLDLNILRYHIQVKKKNQNLKFLKKKKIGIHKAKQEKNKEQHQKKELQNRQLMMF